MLPAEARNNIYERVLAVPHPLHMFQEPGCPVETFAPEKPYRWLSLLYTNRQVSAEAIKALYGMNHFVLEEMETKRRGDGLLISLLRSIGPVNAGLLSHLSMNFPAMERVEGQSGEPRIREDSLHNLHQLKEQCTGLKTLETFIYGQNASLLTEESQNNARSVQKILSQINSEFRGIASLENIVVRVCSGSLDSPTREYMEQLGWVVLRGSI